MRLIGWIFKTDAICILLCSHRLFVFYRSLIIIAKAEILIMYKNQNWIPTFVAMTGL